MQESRETEIVDTLHKTLNDSVELRSLARSGPQVLDGRGGFRIGSAIMDLFQSRF